MRKLNPDIALGNFLIRFLFTTTFMLVISFFLTNFANAQNVKTTAEEQNPECFAKVGYITGRNVSKKVFTAQQGVIAYIKINASHWEPIIVNNFSLVILRDSSVVFQYKNNGNRFDSSVRAAFRNLQSDDVVLIYSLKTQLPEKKIIFVNPFGVQN